MSLERNAIFGFAGVQATCMCLHTNMTLVAKGDLKLKQADQVMQQDAYIYPCSP